VWALRNLACGNDTNQVLIAAAGGIPPLVDLLRDGSAEATELQAAHALGNIAHNSDASAVAIALAVGFEAVVELARRGRVTVDNWDLVHDAGVPAKRKAALVVAALLGDCVPDSVPREIKGLIGPYL
jgi:vacuolar protein 8